MKTNKRASRRDNMKKVIIKQKRKKDFIWTSGNILCKQLHNDFDPWKNRKLNNFQ